MSDALATGVEFESIRLLTNSSAANTGGGIRIDEIRIATDWASAVSGLVIPEPSSLLLVGLGGLAMVARRRRR